jgi:PadR family transcriptional regulator, regulatory protein PadR
MIAQLLKGHLDLLLLSVLGDGPLHGYRIIEALRERSGAVLDLGEGTVYPALHRLERSGWLSSAWSDVDGRKRRTYRLTPLGQREMARQHAEWRHFNAAVTRVMGGS